MLSGPTTSAKNSGATPRPFPRMSLPIVVIVGRPNVGKSTLFNYLMGERRAIVEDQPGVTRDRHVARARWEGRPFLLIDTGGLVLDEADILSRQIGAQAKAAITDADLVVHLVDGRTGVHPADREIGKLLRRTGAATVTAVNKVDGVNEAQVVADFAELGAAHLFPISALHGNGLRRMMDEACRLLPLGGGDERLADLSIAVVGRPNAGKSTLVNTLLNDKRMVVSPIPGTTRDAVDTYFNWSGKRLRIIDTAGLRRKRETREGVERYSVVRSLRAMLEAEVSIFLVDAEVGCREQETKIAGYLHEHQRACVVAVNKWDQVTKGPTTFDDTVAEVRRRLKFVDYAPIVTISAVTKQRVFRLLETVWTVAEEYRRRVDTATVNKVLQAAINAHPPRRVQGRRPRLLYASQTGTAPPTIVVFCNRPEEIHFSYRRYLLNRFHEGLDLRHTPIRLVLRGREDGRS
jgi:GTP-binding protein